MRRFCLIALIVPLFCWCAVCHAIPDGPRYSVAQAQMPEIGAEVVSYRTRNFKTNYVGGHTYSISGGIGPIHYKADPFDVESPWQDIDLTVALTPGEAWDAACESNGYQVRFWQTLDRGGKTFRYVAQFQRAGRWLAMAPVAVFYTNNAGQRQLVSNIQAVGAPTIDNVAHTVQWDDAFGSGLHFRYNLQPDKFFKTLVITAKSDLPVPTIGAAGLRLVIAMAVEWDFDAKTSNDFAKDISVELGDDDSGAADETLTPDTFSQRDVRGDLWWWQQPRAWDSAEESHDVAVTWQLRRKGSNIYALFSVTAAQLNNAATVYPVFVDTVISEQIDAGDDDGLYIGAWSNTDTEVILGSLGYTGGFRFALPIPQGATIDSAYMQMYNKVGWAGSSSMTVDMDLDATPEGYALGATAPASRTHTASTDVTWNQDTSVGWKTSPDLSAHLQEVVNLAGWSSGNDASFLILGVSGSNRIHTYESSTSLCAKIDVTYTEAASGPSIPVVMHYRQQMSFTEELDDFETWHRKWLPQPIFLAEALR